MKKILSIKQKDLVSGLSPYKNDSRFGLLYSANGYSPSLFGGGIAFTKAPVNISSTVVVDSIRGFANYVDVLYAMGSNGHFYKITNLTNATPTVVDLKSAGVLTTPAYGITAFQTIVGGVKIYYFNNSTKIGQLAPATDTFSDSKYSLAIGHAGIAPVHVIYDRLFFGAQNYVSMLYDDLTNADPALSEQVFDIPKGEQVQALTDDGSYLIVAGTKGSNTTVETSIYFWEWKDSLASWSKSYNISDQIKSMKTSNGITYAIGARGLWAFSYGNYPVLLREDVKSTNPYTNTLGILKDSILIGQATSLYSYGKPNQFFPTSLLSLSTGYDGTILSTNFNSQLNRGFVGTTGDKLYLVDYATQKTASSDSIITSYVDLGNKYDISRIDLVFVDDLASGDSVAIVCRGSDGTTEGKDYVNGSTVSFTNNVAVKDATSQMTPSLSTDSLSLELTISGTCVIKRIDIYGEPTNR
jgi:hypothetical protein